MPKKTRKKSPKTASRKVAGARSVRSPKTLRTKTASKSGKTTTQKTGKAVAGASHKAPSKPLKPGPARSKRAAAKPGAGKPAVGKRADAKTDPKTARPSALTAGAKAPAFRLPRDGGGIVSLSDYSGKNLVLFFYPRADTPGCTREAIDFTRLSGAFAEIRTALLGVSADPPRAQEAFRDKHQLATPLVSDEQHSMLEAYGAWGEKSMYGRTFQGVLRTTVLIGTDGRILKIWRHVKVDGHADDVLAAVRAL